MHYKGRTIITYLIEGNPNGLKTVEFSNKLIKGISIPRKDLKDAIETRSELKHSGVYFLIGEDEEENNMTYIGQATVLYKRLHDHYKDTNKDFRNNAVCFTYKDGSLNESDINYLEKSIINEAKNADRYKILNGTSGNNGLIQEHRLPDMIEFVEDLKILTSNLGYSILTKLINKEDHTNEDEIYYLTKRGSNAQGMYTDEGFLVFSGSELSPKGIISYQKNLGNLDKRRNTLIEKGIIVDNRFIKDYEFKTPTAACNVISGGNLNGRIEWKTKAGKTLDEIIRKNNSIG